MRIRTSVRADPEIAAGDLYGDVGRVAHFFLETVDVDVVISGSLHFSEFHAIAP
jgi:hypothetical protein